MRIFCSAILSCEIYWWEDCFCTFFSHRPMQGRASTLAFPSAEALTGEVLEKVDELGNRLFVIISELVLFA
jgi:hypothetical protein